MSEQLKESISALMDDEISEIELHRLVRQFGDKTELKQSWIAYQQIRSVAEDSNHLSAEQHFDLHSSISAAIDAEPAFDGASIIHASKSKAQSQSYMSKTWFKPVVGFAAAASVVVAVLITTGVGINDGSGLESGFDTAANTVGNDNKSIARTSSVIQTQPASTNTAPQAQQAMADLGMVAQDAQTVSADMPEELRALSPQAQEKLRQYLLKHELMNRRANNSNMRTVNFKSGQPTNKQQAAQPRN